MRNRKRGLQDDPCYDCLSKDGEWLMRYVVGWLALGCFAIAAFVLVKGPLAIWAQALCFLLIFVQTFRPIVAAHSYYRR